MQKETGSIGEKKIKKKKMRDSDRFLKEGYPVARVSIFLYYLIKE